MRYYITLADGTLVPADSKGLLVRNEDITAVKTLTEEDSGKVFTLNAAEGVAITLPALEKGLEYEFIVGAVFATTDFTIVSSTNVIQGGSIVNSVFVPAANENTISFVATAETLGDKVRLICDGTNWYAEGVGAGAGSITFTAV